MKKKMLPEIGQNGLVTAETEVQPSINPVFNLKIGPDGVVTMPCTLLARLHLQEGDIFEVHTDQDQTFRGQSTTPTEASDDGTANVNDDGTKAA